MQRKAYRLSVGNSVTAFFEALGLVNDITLQHTTVPGGCACVLSNVEAWRAGQYRLAMAFGGSQDTILQRVRRVLGQPNRYALSMKAIWSSLVVLLMLSFVLVSPQLQADSNKGQPLEAKAAMVKEPCALPCPDKVVRKSIVANKTLA
ncbi:MAG: hypothetical protein GVY26_15010, partial [Bacteroidetes bacterium]|nr:hypothetical protein [Bacteroidota bacterium]